MQPSIHPTDARGSGGFESAAGRRRHRDAECEMAHLKRQIDWFRPQIFGHKSERRIVPVDTGQMSLGEGLTSPETGSPPPTPTQPVAAHHRRRVAQNPGTGPGRCRSSMPTRCPWRSLPLASPEAEALAPEEFEVTDTKETFRLAQRLGSYVVIKYVWPLIKRRADGALCCPAAPVGVIEGSRADVSFLAGLLIDKFAYHLPLYRQHQRLMDAGFRLSRPWLDRAGVHHVGTVQSLIATCRLQGGRSLRLPGRCAAAGRDPPGVCCLATDSAVMEAPLCRRLPTFRPPSHCPIVGRQCSPRIPDGPFVAHATALYARNLAPVDPATPQRLLVVPEDSMPVGLPRDL